MLYLFPLLNNCKQVPRDKYYCVHVDQIPTLDSNWGKPVSHCFHDAVECRHLPALSGTHMCVTYTQTERIPHAKQLETFMTTVKCIM